MTKENMIVGQHEKSSIVIYPEFIVCSHPSVLRVFNLHNPTSYHAFPQPLQKAPKKVTKMWVAEYADVQRAR